MSQKSTPSSPRTNNPDETELSADDNNSSDEFDEQSLEIVTISDDDLASDDKQTAEARKKAKKLAKAQRTPQERRRAKYKKWAIVSGAVLGIVVAVFSVPTSRYPVLNALGFRTDLHFRILQAGSNQPLAGASFKLDDGRYDQSDKNGTVVFAKTKLGQHNLFVEKAGYSELRTKVVAGLRSGKPKTFELKVIGIKVEVDVKDWLSGEAIAGATIKSDKATAQTDKRGHASLVVAPTDKPEIELQLSAAGYLDKAVLTQLGLEAREVTLVTAAKNYFISKRDGKFDIFRANLDGSSQQKIIEATGKEDEGLLQFTVNRANKQAVLVATRDSKQLNNRLIAGVYLVDLEKASLKKIDEGSDVQLLDWAEDTIFYSKTMGDLGYEDPGFSRLMSYSLTNGKLNQQAQANYFSVTLVAQNKLFYSPADAYRPIENPSFTSVDTNGTRRNYLDGTAMNYAVRTSYGSLQIQALDGKLYDLQINNGATKLTTARSTTNLQFSSSPATSQVAWVDRRDGQGALLLRSLKDGSERLAVKAAGITSPVRFISESLAVVRVATSQETADYIVHLATGKLTKIVDVSNINISRSGGYGL